MKKIILAMIALCALWAAPVLAQQTSGNITGRIVDAQGAAVPGVSVTARNPQTGFVRTDVSDGEGIYRLTSLPVGTYEVTGELSGFATYSRKDVTVNVAQTTDINIELKLAGVSESVNVTAEVPMVKTTDSSVGGVVDVTKIESLPLNGRQFANLAMTIPGVGLSFHSDPTKTTQYSPQIAGGNGRNVNYQIDGGDNNDDTVGGLLQLYPLEAIQEFNFITQRYKAEYGRSNGGVMNIVTKSGTNDVKGSFFTSFRDDSMNAKTETEKLSKIDKQDYRRYQFGGSFGGPIIQNKAHYFAAVERTQQDTKQAVTTFGLYPGLEGVFPTPSRENLFTAKVSANLSPTQYASVRYGRNTNSQVYNAENRRTQDNWGDSSNTFNSINFNHNWVLAGGRLNEFIFQYADFANAILARTPDPQQVYPNGLTVGYNVNTPQQTQQHKFQFRDDFTWHMTGMGGLGHDLKSGVNFINEPRLYLTFSAGSTDYAYTHLTNDVNGPISRVTKSKAGNPANLPMKQFATYIQDDWRLTSRLTMNAGLRYDVVTGFKIDQSNVPNYVKMRAAGDAGRFNGVPGFEEFAKKEQEDTNNIQPRIGAVYDLRGNGKDIIRGGWGIYYDFGYTNATILIPGSSAQGGSGTVFDVNNTAGIKNPDGSSFTFGQPISNIASQNGVTNPNGPFFSTQIAAPYIRQPWTAQTSVGWSHELTPSTVVDVDYVHTDGHDLGVRWALNTRINGGARRFADLGLSPDNPTLDMSIGKSRYNGVTFGIRRRMDHHVQLNAWYLLSRAEGLGGLAVDELTTNLVQDSTDPYADVQWGPAARADSTHKLTMSAVIQGPWQLNISPIYRFRSALPLHTWYGYDNNLDGVSNDLFPTAFAFKGIDDAGVASWKEIGACTNVNCSRGASLHQLSLRVSKMVQLGPRLNVELIGDFFNITNAIDPAFNIGAAAVGAVYTGTLASHTANTVFMKPNAYAGDTGQPEQRVAQLGFRVTF